MNYEQFLEQMKEDLTARFAKALPPELADVRIGTRDVEKLQGESYRGLSFRSGDSPVEANLNMTGAFQAYEAGRPYEDILKEVEAQLMKVVDRTPQFNIGDLTDYEAMKPKLMLEVIPQKGNEDRLQNIPHQKVEDMALIYRVDMGDSAGGKMTSVITNQQLEAFGITVEQLHQDALENAPIQDRKLYDHYIQSRQITALFSGELPHFLLLRYEPGELLTNPFSPSGYLQLVVDGDLLLYDMPDESSTVSLQTDFHEVNVLGDIELLEVPFTPLFVEAKSEVYTFALYLEEYRQRLLNDPAFLRYLCTSMAEKLNGAVKASSQATLRQKVIMGLQLIFPIALISQ